MFESTLVVRIRDSSIRWLRLALMLLCVAGLSAQTQPTFHIEANFVRVDVYATRGGAPVSDLAREDFEIVEGDAPQTIAEFTRIAVGTGAPAVTPPREVRTLDQSRQAIGEATARVFVLFLDSPHVDRGATLRIRKPLTDALDRLVGPDDLIAVMTPGLNARDLTFVRRPSSVDQLLGQTWGTRDEVNFTDPVEQRYASCYPGLSLAASSDRGIAQQMILRRREQRTLDSLEELVRHLRGVREERKAVITISNGWRLFTPDASLARPVDGAVPSGPQVTVEPRNGRLTTVAPAFSESTVCESDRQALAQLDEPPRFRQMLDEANRSNVSFYPVDPRGLVTFDEDIVPAAGVGLVANNPTVPIDEDLRRLNERHGSLRLMADLTDGVAIVENSNLAAGLRRVSDDLSMYYLLGYYSTGKLDGKFHSIKVRVKRPGVQIRARRGYLAATASTRSGVDTDRTTSSGPAAAVASAALASALEALGTTSGEPTLRVRAAAAYTPAGTVALSVVADGARGSGGGNEWAGGGDADVMVIDGNGATVASAHAQIAPGSTSVRLVVTSAALPPGVYEIRLREKGTGSSSPSTASTKLPIVAAPAGTGSIVLRRGPTTGNRELPTTDLRFRRTERVRIDAPTTGATAASARLLDRLGKPLPIPVAASVFVDADGTGWMSAQIVLAPLAVGDYVIEVTPDGDESRRTFAAFRLVP